MYHDGEGSPRVAAGGGSESLGDLALDGEGKQFYVRAEQFDDEWAGDVVGEIGDEFPGWVACDSFEQFGGECVFAVEGIPFDELELVLIGQLISQDAREVSVDFDSEHASAACQQFAGECAGAWSDLQDTVAGRDFASVSDGADEIGVGHEVLSEPLSWAGAGSVQEVLDVATCLRHGGRAYIF